MEFVERIRGHLAHLLEMPADEINEDTVLADQQNWDSLTMVTLMAILIEEGHSSPDPRSIDRVVTFRDLVQIAAPN
jgi:acyl carrier protein